METMKAESSSSTREFCQIQDKIDDRPSSPADCAICLEQLTDKSFTNSCLHMFCFDCLLSWSKIKPECPLCKQDFCSIIHNIRSMTDYDEYHVPPPEARLSVFVNPEIAPNPIFARDPHDFFPNQRSFFSYRTTIMSGAYRLPRGRPDNLLIQPYVDNLEIQANFARLNANPTAFSRCNRREIYIKELETLPPPSGGRFRQCTPDFYRENEVQIHRLVRWLQRELSALSLITNRFSAPELLRIIMDMLPIYHINSTTFFNTVYRYLGSHTARFINEFHRFASSPFEMEQYDRECLFVRQRTGSQLSFIVTVGRDDSEDVQIIPNSANHAFRPWIDVNDLGRAHSSSSIGDTITQPSSTRYSGVLSNRLFGHSVPSSQTCTSSSAQTIIDISDSEESDDCMIIDRVRPAQETIVVVDSDDESSTPAPEPIVTTSSSLPIFLPSTSYQCIESVDLTCSTSLTSNHVTTIKRESEDETEALDLSVSAMASGNDILSYDSSVLSTDASSTEIAPKKFSSKKYKRKRSKKYCRVNDLEKKMSLYSHSVGDPSKDLILLTDSSEVKSDDDDSDWTKSHKRKRKTKKVNSRYMAKKRTQPVVSRKVKGVMNSDKKVEVENGTRDIYVVAKNGEFGVDSDQTKKHKSKKRTKEADTFTGVVKKRRHNVACEKSKKVTNLDVNETCPDTEIEEIIKPIGLPRLQSIVRKVEKRYVTTGRSERISTLRSRRLSSGSVCSCPDLSSLKNEPCTSRGIYNRHRETCKFYPLTPYSVQSYLSDSD